MKKAFYEKYPLFDWKFYQRTYPDIPIRNEMDALRHYEKHGHKEHRKSYVRHFTDASHMCIDADVILASRQLYVSTSLEQFEKRFQKKYHCVPYTDKTTPCIFFGVYTHTDIEVIAQHESLRIIVWGGEDIRYSQPFAQETVSHILSFRHCLHCAISDSIAKSMTLFGLSPFRLSFSLVDVSLFYPRSVQQTPRCVYIYNGMKKGREHIYGVEFYTQVQQKLSSYTYILSNVVQAPYEDMPNIYARCFIVLRLTKNHDGNANTVQECEAMNIPVVHNESDYGLKWSDVNDIIRHIVTHDPSKKT
jgi:hypothetical protein